jgi:hypothetical protein
MIHRIRRAIILTSLLGLGALTLVFLASGTCWAEGASDYDYSIEVNIANDSGSDILGPVAVPINGLNLVDGGYIYADADDTLFTDSAHTATAGTGQDLGQNAATWWWWADVPDGTTRDVNLFMNGPDTDHSLPLSGTDQVTVTHAASLNVTTDLTAQASVFLDSLPASAEYLLRKPSQYYLTVDYTNFTFGVYRQAASAAIVQSYTAGEDGGSVFYSTAWEAQTFTHTADFWISKVEVKQVETGAPGDLEARIYATDVDGKPTGGVLTSGSAAVGGSGWATVSVTPYELSADTEYALVLVCAGSAGSNYEWRADTSAPSYAGGARVHSVNGGASWIVDDTYDYLFKVYGLVEKTVSAAASTGSHTVKGTYDGADLKLYIDGDEEDSLAEVVALHTNDEDLVIDFTGGIAQARVDGTDVETPTWVLDLDFEADEMTETDQGDAGDGWTWEGAVEDQSASSNDGAYVITYNPTDVTITVNGLEIPSEPPPDPYEQETTDIVGDMPLDELYEDFPESDDPNNLLTPIRDMADASGMGAQAWFLLLVTVIAAVGSAKLFKFFPSFMGAWAIGFCLTLIVVFMGDITPWVLLFNAMWGTGIIGVHQYWASGR